MSDSRSSPKEHEHDQISLDNCSDHNRRRNNNRVLNGDRPPRPPDNSHPQQRQRVIPANPPQRGRSTWIAIAERTREPSCHPDWRLPGQPRPGEAGRSPERSRMGEGSRRVPAPQPQLSRATADCVARRFCLQLPSESGVIPRFFSESPS